MVVKGVALVVFLLPVVVSLLLGSLVMAEILKEPERELNMWQIEYSSGLPKIASDSLEIIGLEAVYSTSNPIKVEISVTDSIFDCGDLYISINDLSKPSEPVIVTQSGFFGQCFIRNNSLLPVDNEFSVIIDIPGKYEIVVEMNDKHQKEAISVSEKFTVN